jgi:hypothetical protein
MNCWYLPYAIHAGVPPTPFLVAPQRSPMSMPGWILYISVVKNILVNYGILFIGLVTTLTARWVWYWRRSSLYLLIRRFTRYKCLRVPCPLTRNINHPRLNGHQYPGRTFAGYA